MNHRITASLLIGLLSMGITALTSEAPLWHCHQTSCGKHHKLDFL